MQMVFNKYIFNSEPFIIIALLLFVILIIILAIIFAKKSLGVNNVK